VQSRDTSTKGRVPRGREFERSGESEKFGVFEESWGASKEDNRSEGCLSTKRARRECERGLGVRRAAQREQMVESANGGE
jgi:hypothetical protein